MKKVSASDLILLVLSLILLFGSHFGFHACPPKADGSWMLCHWAEHTVTALGIVFAVLSLVRFFVDFRIKSGISLSFVPLTLFTALVPGLIIKLCMVKDMRCHTVMRPAVIVLSLLILSVSVIDFIVSLKKSAEK